MKKISISLLLILSMLIMPISNSTFNIIDLNVKASDIVEEPKADLKLYLETYNRILNEYPGKVDEEKLIESSLKAMLNSVDNYSTYYNKYEAADFFGTIMGVKAGLGIGYNMVDEGANIIRVMRKSPAQESGIVIGDLIVEIDGEKTVGKEIDEIKNKLIGEMNSTVKLVIKRNNNLIIKNIKRGNYEIDSIEAKILNKNIGYIKVYEFNQNTTSELNVVLARKEFKNVDKLIIDMRNNLGGLLNQAISFSDIILPGGDLVHIVEKNKPLKTHKITGRKKNYKIILLVNENTASAAEIFGAALKDMKAGIVLGTKTYGKGVVQNIEFTNSGGIISLTIAEYLSPKKNKINNIGIEPDIKIEEIIGEDIILKRAIEIFEKNKYNIK